MAKLDAVFGQIDKAIEIETKQLDNYEVLQGEYITRRAIYISENVLLSEITEIKGRIGYRGYTKKDLVDKDNGAISLGPSNIIKSKLNLDKCTYISWNKYHESPEIIINKNDVVLCKTGSVGKCALIDELNHPITLNPQLIVLKNIKINPKYFAFMFNQ